MSIEDIEYVIFRATPIPSGDAPIQWNDAHARKRLGAFQRPPYGPSHVQRLGHVALLTPAPQERIAWYCETLGMKPSELTSVSHQIERKPTVLNGNPARPAQRR